MKWVPAQAAYQATEPEPIPTAIYADFPMSTCPTNILREFTHTCGHINTTIQAVRFGYQANPVVRVVQVWQGASACATTQEITAAQARALALQLVACAEAIEAVVIRKPGTGAA